MTSVTAQELASTACEILEEAAFIFAEPCEAPPPAETPLVVARVPMLDAPQADLVLAVPPSVSEEIAANLLGLEAGDPEASAKRADAVGELLNMIAGSMLSRVGDRDPIRFGTPRVELLAEPRSAFHIETLDRVVLLTENGDRIWTALDPSGNSREPGA